MNCTTVDELIIEIKKEIDNIWINEPSDIFNIKNGYLSSNAGVYDQYFTPLVMLSGEIRALGIHIFADLNYFAHNSGFTLETLKVITKRMISIDVGVISFFGLKKYGALLENFNRILDSIECKDKYAEVIREMFTLTNRYQMWLHQIFPWGFCVFMPKKAPGDFKKIYDRMSQNL